MNSRFTNIEKRILDLETLVASQAKEIELLKGRLERKNAKRKRNTEHSRV